MVFRILCAMALPAAGGSGSSSRREAEAAAGRAGELDDVHIFIRKHVAQSQVEAFKD